MKTMTIGDTMRSILKENLLEKINNPLLFKPSTSDLGRRTFHGYEADVLVDICDAIYEGRKNDKLLQSQLFLAEQAEILIRSFAKVGVVALIDEVTGYQHDREEDALQKILSLYVEQELLPWTKKFPDVFYEEMFRLKKWSKPITKRSGLCGKYTNTYVYDMLPKGVLTELKKKNPKNESGNRIR